MKFIDYADQNQILLLILPPHSTHQLQPLDVGVFSPLANAYSQQIDEHLQSTLGYVQMTKRHFWRLFHAAWLKALTAKNILSGFKTTGIHPLHPELVLNQLRKQPPPSVSSPQQVQSVQQSTPTSTQALRHVVKEFQRTQTQLSEHAALIIRASEKLAFDRELLMHENTALQSALYEEKKQRKRGKGMGLNKNNPGMAQFWSPSKVAAAKQQANEDEAAKQDKIAQAQEAKLQQAIEKEQKAKEVQERKNARKRARIEARDCQEKEKAERERAKAQRQQQQAAKKLAQEQAREQRKIQQQEQAAKRKNKKSSDESLQPAAKHQQTRLGCTIRPPQHLHD
jgi:hypothetical protein